MRNAHFYIYNVGHGVCTLLKGTKNDGKTPYCGIFDCGTRGPNHLCIQDDVIVNMTEKVGDIGYIDDVVISHQDEDHWSMFLSLFSMLNGMGGTYEDIAFGKKGVRAWKLSSNKGGAQTEKLMYLYILASSSYSKIIYAEKYTASAQVVYNIIGTSPVLITSCVSINYMNESNYVVKFTRNEKRAGYIIEISINGNQTFSGFLKLNSIEDLIAKVIRNYMIDDPSEIHDALYDVAYSLNAARLNYLNTELCSCVDIIKPIKRVIMGGDWIQSEYERLKDLLSDMSIFYSGGNKDCFSRVPYGAYITMTENKNPKFKIRSFPEYAKKNKLQVPTDTAEYRNYTSAVVQFNIDDKNIIILPGDVTAHAFPAIAEQIANEKMVPSGALKMFLAPHHGTDTTNFGEHLSLLFELITEKHEECNLVISGYNKYDLHPGGNFLWEAMGNFGTCGLEHGYACALCLVDEEPEYLDTLGKVFHSYQRIFTTNFLAEGEKYYEFEFPVGSVSGDTIQEPKPDPSLNLPPDDGFI